MSANQYTSEFIEEYKQLPELWKIKSDCYKNRDHRQKGYETLHNKMLQLDSGITLGDVKKKINNIRSCYRRELKKITQSEKSGAGADEIYVSSLRYFDQLDFLRDQESQEQGRSTMDEESSVDSHLDQQNVKKSQTKNESRENLLDKAVEHLDNIRQKAYDKDEASVFSDGWATMYRKLSPEQQLFSKRCIDEVLYQARFENLSALSYRNIEGKSITPYPRTFTPISISSAVSTPSNECAYVLGQLNTADIEQDSFSELLSDPSYE